MKKFSLTPLVQSLGLHKQFVLFTAVGALMPSLNAVAGPGEVDVGGVKSPTYYANSPSGTTLRGSNTGTALRKFVDKLPVPGTAASANNLGQYIPVAVPEKWVTPHGTTTNDDYYELAMVEFTEKLHSDLKGATLMRGYVQIATPKWLAANPGKGVPLFYPGTRNADGSFAPGKPIVMPDTGALAVAVEAPHALGPAINATAGVAVRLLVRNLLPFGRAGMDAKGNLVRNGDLFLPVDKTIIGAGVAADGVTYYTENRASVHLHGGDSPWISDGTPYQWFAPAGDAATIASEQAAMASATAAGQPVPTFTPVADVLRGASAKNVPDMPDPGPGAMTFYYPNRQTARQLWYHDHTVGLTRVNVYAGLAAPYFLTDAKEQAMKASGALPADEIPLVITDKTFVPDDIALQDRNWHTAAWGLPGDMWFPHVYESAGSTNVRNNGFTAAADAIDGIDRMGGNPTARWDFGPELGEVTGPLPPLMTGEYGPAAMGTDGQIRSPSTTPEAFMDTPLVNGTAYPTLAVEPRAYRFRLLNATNDRFLNLGLYQAEDQSGEAKLGATEVRLMDVPAPGAPPCDVVDTASGLASSSVNRACWPAGWPTTDNVILPKVPDPTTAGPKIVQIGNETGWLPKPRHIVSTPASYAAAQNSGFAGVAGPAGALNNVGTHGLYMSPAERSDIVIDFSQYAGKTLILYNDSPAPAPGFDDRYDYFTGNADLSGAGGAESTLPGYGPNTRTIMQIRVANATPAAALDFVKLDTDIQAAYASRNEPALVVTADAVAALLAKRGTTTLPAEVLGASTSVSVSIVDKAIVEEWDPNFGRLNAIFGIVTDNGPKGLAYADAPTEFMRDGETTLWRIAHTGVDTHPVHFHLVNVQIVARVNADGSVEEPDVEERGWKETVKMNPAQDIIVAFRPKKPELGGFTVPSSIRMLDPTQKDGVSTGFTQIDLVTGGSSPTPVVNKFADLAWEYVWHCHILGHEENDFMRVVSFIPNETAPLAPSLSAGAQQLLPVTLSFTDKADNEYEYRIERADGANATTGFTSLAILPALTGPTPAVPATGAIGAVPAQPAQTLSWTDNTAAANVSYTYRVSAVGSQTQYTAGQASGLTQAISAASVTVQTGVAPDAPATAPTATLITASTLTLSFPAGANATRYKIEHSTDGGSTWAAATVTLPVAQATTVTAAVTVLLPATSYLFRVASENAFATSAPTTSATPVRTLASLLAPTLGAPTSAVTNPATGAASVTLNWANTSTGQTAYKVERFTGTLANSARAGSVWTTLNAAYAAPGAATTLMSYTDTTAAAGTAYVYRLTAIDQVPAVATVGVAASQALTSAIAVAAPTLVSASTAGTTVTLSFTDNSTNETSFQVFRTTPGVAYPAAATGTVTRTAALGTATGGAVTFADATAVAGATYLYKVVAVNTTGVAPNQVNSLSPASIELTVNVVLSAPTGLSAVPAIATATATPITVSFTDTSVGETGFEVYRSTDGGATFPTTPLATVARTAAQGTSVNVAVTYSDTTAVPGVSYAYRVRAVNATATAASTFATSGPVSITIAAPSSLTATPGTSMAGALTQPITLTWIDNATNDTRYSISRLDNGTGLITALTPVARTAAQGTAVATPVSFTDATAAMGASYTYTVVAERVVGTVVYASSGNPSVSVTNTANMTASAAPSALTANTAGGVSVALNWLDNSTNETNFTVNRSADNGATWTLVSTVARTAAQRTAKGGVTTFTDATAVVGVAYQYRVDAAIPAVGAVPASTLSSNIVTAQLTLAVPNGVAVTQVPTGLQVAWFDQSNNEAGFQIVRTDPNGVQLITTVASTAAQKTAVGGAARTWIDTTAVAGVSYSYVVRAVVYSGTVTAPVLTAQSADSAPAVYGVRTVTAPSVPTAAITTATSITVSWTDLSTNETGFIVERQITPVVNGVAGVPGGWTQLGAAGSVATVTRTATLSTAVNGTVSFVDTLVAPVVQGSYEYRVRAVNATGTVINASSATVAAAPLNFAAPSAPSAVTVAAAVPPVAGSLVVSWADNSANETGFSVQYSTNPAFPAGATTVTRAIAGANPGATASTTLTGLVTGSQYHVRVASSNKVGLSAYVAAPTAVAAP